MTRCLPPRRLPSATVVAAALLLTGPAFFVVARAQEFLAPGTPDNAFVIDRTRNVSFVPSQNNYTPFALALQPGQDPVQPSNPNIREVPAAQTKLLVAGDGAVLYRSYLTRTVNATTVYAENNNTQVPAGTPVTTYSAPFQPGDTDNVFFPNPNTSNGIGSSGRIAYSLSVDPDGGVLVGGLFGKTSNPDSFFEGDERNFVLLNYNGDPEITVSADGTSSTPGPFNTAVGRGANDSVLAILRRTTLEPDEDVGRVLLGGQFIRFNRIDRGRLVQLLPSGAPDDAFNDNLGSGANGIVFSLAETLDPVTGAPNGQAYVCGDFDSFNGNGPGKVVRLNADGTRDTSFTPSIRGRAIAVAVQPDGKVLVGGDLDSINGTAVNNLARLNPDGTLDTDFLDNVTVSLSSPNNIPPTSVYVLRVQADGRILVGGNYLRLDGTDRRYLGRLEADGTLDVTFNPGDTLSNAAQSVVYVPRDPSEGDALDLIYSQTRADRKKVPGDEGFFPAPVRRLFGDDTASHPAAIPGGDNAPLVRIGAVGPVATVGDLTPRPDIVQDPTASRAVPNPGTPGLFRVTREGSTAADLVVHLKVVGGPGSPAAFNTAYDLRQFIFTPATTTTGSTTTVSNPLGGPRFDVTIPAGDSSADILVEGLDDGVAQGDQTVTLKLKAATDVPYSVLPDRKTATVTILANNF